MRKAKSIDAIHDLLLRIGDLTADEVAARSVVDLSAPPRALQELVKQRRVIEVSIAREKRYIARAN